MIVILHVIIAGLSLVGTTYLLLLPSRRKLIVSYWLIGLTLASGTYLVFALHVPLLRTCVSGLAYLVVTMASVAGARYRLGKRIS